jgi:hypothetical protein
MGMIPEKLVMDDLIPLGWYGRARNVVNMITADDPEYD